MTSSRFSGKRTSMSLSALLAGLAFVPSMGFYAGLDAGDNASITGRRSVTRGQPASRKTGAAAIKRAAIKARNRARAKRKGGAA